MIPGFKETLDKMYEIHLAKNNDYAGEKDPYANFRMVEKLGICDIETGIMVRLCDKFSRLITLMNSKDGPKVTDEKLEDTMIDAANYLVIWKCYREQKKELKK
jgi:hypothetical protein